MSGGMSRHFQAIVILPVAVLVLVPAVVVSATGVDWGFSSAGSAAPAVGLGILLLVPGAALLFSTFGLYVRRSNGTLSRGVSPKRLVVRGPYRYVRNPVHSGVFLVLFAEGLLFGSEILLLIGVAFCIVHMWYIPFVEERDLYRRFGTEYDRYCENVPRWIPRATPWEAPPGA